MISGLATEARHVLRVRGKVARAAQASAKTFRQIVRFGGVAPTPIGLESLFQCLAQHSRLRDSPVASRTLKSRIELVGNLARHGGHEEKVIRIAVISNTTSSPRSLVRSPRRTLSSHAGGPWFEARCDH